MIISNFTFYFKITFETQVLSLLLQQIFKDILLLKYNIPQLLYFYSTTHIKYIIQHCTLCTVSTGIILFVTFFNLCSIAGRHHWPVDCC